MKNRSRLLAYGALIGAMYAALTHLQNLLIPGSASFAIQFRASEALAALAFFTPAAIPGLSVGCFVFNLTFSGALPLDIEETETRAISATLGIEAIDGAIIAGIVSFAMFFITSENKNILQEVSKANWATYALSATIVFLEFGYLMVYRVGWPVSIASLVSNLVVSCVLLFVGLLFYKEIISARQLVGCIVCAVGLFLVSK